MTIHTLADNVEIVDGPEVSALPDIERTKVMTHHLVDDLFALELEQATSNEAREHIKEQHEGLKESFAQSLPKMIDDGSLSVVRIDGEIVGMAGYSKTGQMPDGRDVYEMKRMYVLPRFRGRRLGSRLNEHIFARLREMYPQSPILIRTRKEPVKRWMSRHGFIDLSRVNIDEEWGTDPEMTNDIRTWSKKTVAGGDGYLWDPKAATDLNPVSSESEETKGTTFRVVLPIEKDGHA